MLENHPLSTVHDIQYRPNLNCPPYLPHIVVWRNPNTWSMAA